MRSVTFDPKQHWEQGVQRGYQLHMERQRAFMDAMYGMKGQLATREVGVEKTIRYERERYATGAISLDDFERRVEELLRWPA